VLRTPGSRARGGEKYSTGRRTRKKRRGIAVVEKGAADVAPGSGESTGKGDLLFTEKRTHTEATGEKWVYPIWRP